MTRAAGTTPKRRRGAALEQALLGAAWAELTENGYARFTMEAVADRAQTSTPVLYRRWPDRWSLAVAALLFYAEQNPIAQPDTGTLRGDLIAYLSDVAAKRGEIAALFSLRMAEFFDEANTSLAQLREVVMAERPMPAGAVYDRAIARGEIDPATLTARRRTLAFDLIRNELIMTLRPISARVIEQIVDDIVLPVLTQPTTEARPTG